MSEHTPGPWAVSDDRHRDGTLRIFATDGPAICNLRHGAMEANARVIAASPEMFQALVLERDMEREFLARGSMGSKEYEARRKYIHGLKAAALAKAEGHTDPQPQPGDGDPDGAYFRALERGVKP